MAILNKNLFYFIKFFSLLMAIMLCSKNFNRRLFASKGRRFCFTLSKIATRNVVEFFLIYFELFFNWIKR